MTSLESSLVHIVSDELVEDHQAETIIAQFIEDEADTIEGAGFKRTAAINQLKRIQRDLRGLPPVLMEMRANEPVSDVETRVEPPSVDKEERKRLKKERRRQEKIAQIEANHD